MNFNSIPARVESLSLYDTPSTADDSFPSNWNCSRLLSISYEAEKTNSIDFVN